jgi:hypothetical protein
VAQSWPRTFAFQDGRLSPESEVFQASGCDGSEDTKSPDHSRKKIEYGGNAVADRIVGPAPDFVDFKPGQHYDHEQPRPLARFAVRMGTTSANVRHKILLRHTRREIELSNRVLEPGKIPRESLRENLRSKSFLKGLPDNVPSLQDNVKKKKIMIDSLKSSRVFCVHA